MRELPSCLRLEAEMTTSSCARQPLSLLRTSADRINDFERESEGSERDRRDSKFRRKNTKLESADH